MKKWDIRYLNLIRNEVQKWSKDPSTQVGAVIVRPDKTICSMGFNGFPTKMEDKFEYLNNREEKYSRVIHGEMNALLFAKEPVKGYTLYTSSGAPCDRCCVHMIQAGIIRFVFPEATEDYLSRWRATVDRSKMYIQECDLSFEEIPLEELG